MDLIHTLPDGKLAIRAAIDDLEYALRAGVADGTLRQTIYDGGTPEGDAQCQHFFGDGVYVRSLWIPAGTCVVGRVHKQARVCMILAGTCMWVDEDHRERVAAPWIGEFKAGCKTVVYAETDTLWAAALGTDLKDSVTVFDTLTCPDHVQYQRFLEKQTCAMG